MAERGRVTERLDAILAASGLEDHAATFASEDVDDSLLEELTDADLRALGLSLGARKRFLAALAETAAAPDVPVAERRHLTVVFCDLVGSTQLAQRFDPEDLRQIISSYLDTAIGTMEAHGCHLAYTQGDGFMMYFGYPKAGEDDAERALRATLTTIDAVRTLKTKVPEGLDMRAGIASGLVVVGDIAPETKGSRDFVVGEPPNLASRLQGLAEPGEVVVSEETWALTRGSFEFEARGAHSLKGFSERRRIFRVVGENMSASRFEARSGHRVQSLVGRLSELGTLSDAWAEAQSGRGRIAFVQGPPGIGKSRLIRQLVDQVGAYPYYLQCSPHLVSSALHPVVSDLRRVAGKDANETTVRANLFQLIETSSELTEADMPLLLDLVGVAMTGETPDALRKARMTQDLLMRAIRSLCAARGTLLLVLEDVHWADATTQEFTESVIAALDELPILFVMTHRPEYAPSETARPRAVSVDLSPLDVPEAMALAQSVAAPRELPGILLRRIVEKADGVPLFVEEMTKALLPQVLQQGQIRTEALDAIVIPATIHDSLLSRLDRMGQAKTIAQLGAVIGRSFTAPMLRALVSDGVDVDACLADLRAAGLVVQVGREDSELHQFNHALVQDAAYDSLLKDDRRVLHLKLARAMLDDHPAFGLQSPDIVARHCDLGGLRDEAVTHWILAGEQAAGRSANIPAISAFRAALRNLEEMHEHPERERLELGVQMRLAPAYMAIHGWGAEEVGAAAARAQDLAQRLGDHESLFGATWGRWTNHFLRGDLDPALETAHAIEAMAAAGPPGLPTVMAHYTKSYTHYFRGELDEAMKHTDAGIAAGSAELDLAMLPIFQIAAGSALRAIRADLLWLIGRTKEAYAAREEALGWARRLNHAPNLVHCYALTSMFLIYARDWPMVDKAMHEAMEIAEEEGFLYFQPMHNLYLNVSAFAQHGQWDAVETVNAIADAVSGSGANLTLAQSECVLADLLVDAGQLDHAMRRLDTVCAKAFSHGEAVMKSEYHRVRSRIFAARGDYIAAAEEAERALEDARGRGAKALAIRAEEVLEEFAT